MGRQRTIGWRSCRSEAGGREQERRGEKRRGGEKGEEEIGKKERGGNRRDEEKERREKGERDRGVVWKGRGREEGRGR